MNVLLWSPQGAGFSYSGAGLAALRLYEQLAVLGVKPTLVHFNPGHQAGEIFEEVVCLGDYRGGPWTKIASLKVAERWLRANCGSFDLFHGLTGYELTVKPAALSQSLGLPSVIKVANHKRDFFDPTVMKRVCGFASRRVLAAKGLSGVISISSAISDELRGLGFHEECIREIPNGVDTMRFCPVECQAERSLLRGKLGIPDLPTVLFVGEVVRRKQPHLIVDAVGLLRKRGVVVQLLIVGPQPDVGYRQSMDAAAVAGGVSDQLLYCEFVVDTSMHFRAADVFCLPSRNEGLPNAMLEAMATGLPVIGTKVSGITDLIDNTGAGFFCGSTAEGVADSIVAALSPAGLRIGHKARRLALSRYSLPSVADEYCRLFSELSRGARKADGRS